MNVKSDVGIDRFWVRIAEAGRLLLGLDYDGTLAPFKVDRMAATPLPGLLQILKGLRDRASVELAIISGRRLDELEALLPLTGVEFWGSHGYQRRRATGTTSSLEVGPSQREALKKAALAAARQGLPCEMKHASVAVHSRGLDQIEASERDRIVKEIWHEASSVDQMVLAKFDGGLELKVKGVDKGRALSTWLSDLGEAAGDLIIFVGDDKTDEDAFARVAELGGFGIKVGVGFSLAQGRVRDPQAVKDLLAEIAVVRSQMARGRGR